MRFIVALLATLAWFVAPSQAQQTEPRDLGKAPAFVTVIGIFCLESNELVCDEHVMADSSTVPADEPLYMSSCMGYAGQSSAIKYMEEHAPSLKGYKFRGVKCQFGNKPPLKDQRV
jgi:hypothetical protein